MEGDTRQSVDEDRRHFDPGFAVAAQAATTTTTTTTTQPSSIHQPYISSSIHAQQQPSYESYDYSYPAPHPHDTRRAPPQQASSAAAFAATNQRSVASNAGFPAGQVFDNTASTEPDAFYRNYRDFPPADVVSTFLDQGPVEDGSMASTTSTRRPPPLSGAFGRNVSSRIPAATTTRNTTNGGNRQPFRSVSTPLEDNSSGLAQPSRGYNSGRPPSVKDLKKKFDQQGGQTPDMPRRPSGRVPPTRPREPTMIGYGQSRQPSQTEPPTNGSATRTKTRPRLAAEGSEHAQSFASRINAPRSPLPNAQASKSMTHLSTKTQENSPLPSLPSGGLLFGEVLPEDLDRVTAGYGIDSSRPRTAESHALGTDWRNQHGTSDDPASPTDWYRGASMQQPNGEAVRNVLRKPHNRSQSDLAGGAKQNATPRRHAEHSATLSSGSASRLPVSVRRSSNPSVSSTRSNSPTTLYRSATNGSTNRSHAHSTSRSKTPTPNTKPPSRQQMKTPTRTSRRTGSDATLTNNDSGNRLTAAVAAPLPKLSPPLRSSRPRQPVSSATTASSRSRAVDFAKPPLKLGSRPPSRQDAANTSRRKISVGPVDFAERRETIKLKYSKSIRETEARQVREAAAEKRRAELEAAARAKMQAQARAQAAASSAIEAASRKREASKTPDSMAKYQEQNLRALKVNTAVSLPRQQTHLMPAKADAYDSPTLGMPGEFPSFGAPEFSNIGDLAPTSAISNTNSAVTEFDNEAQTEPPSRELSNGASAKATNESGADESLNNQRQISHLPKATYRDPFEDDENDRDTGSIKISLEAITAQHVQPQQQAALVEDYTFEAKVPGAFGRDSDSVRSMRVPFVADSVPMNIKPDEAEVDPPIDSKVETEYELDLKPEYEPQPVSNPYHSTKVTIVSRDSSYAHVPGVIGGTEAELEALVNGGSKIAQENVEEFYTGPKLGENIAKLRESTFTASDTDFSDGGGAGQPDMRHTPDTSNSLTVPRVDSSENRSSRHSTWTDFSIDSTDGPGLGSSRDADSHLEEDILTDGQSASSRPLSLREDSTARLSHLPEVDTGTGFSIRDFTELRNAQITAIPSFPSHAPPAPPSSGSRGSRSRPVSGFYSNRPTSSILQTEQSSSLALSRETSMEHPPPPPLSMAQSVEHAPIASASVTSARPSTEAEIKSPPLTAASERSAPSEKEKKSLHQRKMILEELVHTEAVFVRDMTVIEEIYKGTAEACPKLDNKTVKLIFRNTDEIVVFHNGFLAQLKEDVSVGQVSKDVQLAGLGKEESSNVSNAPSINSTTSTAVSTTPSGVPSSTTAAGSFTTSMDETDETRDRQIIIGPTFIKNIEDMRLAHEGFLRSSDAANKRLIEIQEDPAVKVWLNECNDAAKELTAAWNLDSLLIKPMQRITKYPNLISQLIQHTPADHPDRENLAAARIAVENAILDINKTKKNFELVGQIVTRRRKESDVKAGFARAFGKRVDKLQASNNRPEEDADFVKMEERFRDDFLHLQVVLRDFESYNTQITEYVHDFLNYLTSMELIMRLQPGPYPEIESKWVQFSVSMRDIEKVVLEQHVSQVRKMVIEPIEQVIRCYTNPQTALKKRAKRRLDYEKFMQLKKGGKKIDKQLNELVEHYEALNETLKKELPQLSAMTKKIGTICIGSFVNIQTRWYSIWKGKVEAVVGDAKHTTGISDIVSSFHNDFRYMEDEAFKIALLNPTLKPRMSSATGDESQSSSFSRPRLSDVTTSRSRGMSANSDAAPTLPTPDFIKRNSGHYVVSPSASIPSPGHAYYRDYYTTGINGHLRGPASPGIGDMSSAMARAMISPSTRPTTSQSHNSTSAVAMAPPRPSIDSVPSTSLASSRRESAIASSTATAGGGGGGGGAGEGRRFSGLFHSAMPAAEGSNQPSRAVSPERATAVVPSTAPTTAPVGAPTSQYDVLWLAASLFEFHIPKTRHEAGYPYLTYAAGEIFDVIGEKGELWLAKNQDDASAVVGWIWSKHFAKLADA